MKLPTLSILFLAYPFHSSYIGTIKKYANQYKVDPRKLIIAVCEHDQVNAPPKLVEDMAVKLSTQGVKEAGKTFINIIMEKNSFNYGRNLPF